jgi:hypothetical protein
MCASGRNTHNNKARNVLRLLTCVCLVVATLAVSQASAFPPGSGVVKGRAAIEAMWKAWQSKIGDPKLTTLDVKLLGPSSAREIGTFTLKTKGCLLLQQV